MTDVEEIIDYIKSLKKGFDKQLFESKIEELASLADSSGLDYDDFHTLFKVWLNLSIPITKWVNLGSCIVPQDKVAQNTVEYCLKWLLANYKNQNNFPRIGHVLDWLTAAMDADSIDMTALDMGYELFYTFLTYEVLTVHTMKLVYMLTKPSDVTRNRVLELMEHAKKRESKKNLFRQLQVLIGLFKSYKPECVPEDIPSISIHTAFRKINANLLMRFQNCQNRRNSKSEEKQRLIWVNALNMENSRNKKAEPLVPNMEFLHVGSRQYNNKAPQKNYLDFSEPVSLLQYSLNHNMSRPARLRALLCNTTGLTLLALADQTDHAFFMHDLHHLLINCFLDISPHSYTEKQDLLRQLSVFQSTLMQGLPVITRFLAQFLPFWNEEDYFVEILDLIEWVNVESPEHIVDILDALTKIYCRAHPIQQCAILKSVTSMYTNLVYASTRSRQYFLSIESSGASFAAAIQLVASKLNDMCSKALQANPDDMRVLFSSVRSLRQSARSDALACGGREGRGGQGVHGGREGVGGCGASRPPALLPLALPLLAPSAVMQDNLAELILLYKQIFSAIKAKYGKDERYLQPMRMLKAYTSDFVSCYYEQFLANRGKGVIFSNLQPQIVNKLANLLPDVDTKLSIRNHLAFSPYTYMRLQAINQLDAENKLLFDTVIDNEFVNLSEFVKMAMPELC
ncbi:centromere protein I-like isoform X2 [Zerene cesonia]|uniref:centromere protein I-like isoform X2 n=1 Tax=Zerene cesonia TaxID=33412 RepID=UPI0018E53608|nr:centromere protein I-like isoform X2 [Zerene cesonia]